MSKFVVEYSKNTDEWEYWQPEYRYGAFYIFPPDEVLDLIGALRKKYDPKSDNICPAHISLSEPLQRPLTGESLAEIQKSVENFDPFEMIYGPIITFPPHPGVCFEVRPADRFFDLRGKLNTCSVFCGSDLSRKSIAPHITIAEFGLTFDESEELKTKLNKTVKGGSFFCASIEYAVPNDAFYFERKLKVPLGSF